MARQADYPSVLPANRTRALGNKNERRRIDRHRDLQRGFGQCTRAGKLVAPVIAFLLGASAAAQQGNPLEGDPEAIRAGGPLYAARCADCHSADARGVRGPDLTQLWTSGRSDSEIFATVRNGKAGTIMPPSQAPDEEIWAIVAYLRDISVVPPFTVADGDAARGREIFADECRNCHRVGPDGGAIGPDLGRIALGHSREALERAIRDPSDTVEPGFRTVTIVAKSGEVVEGIVKREDAFSIQILDREQRLRGYSKADLRSVTHESDSLMPRFGRRRLSGADMNDLLAYLATLRGE